MWNSNRAPTVHCYRLTSYEWSILKERISENHCNYIGSQNQNYLWGKKGNDSGHFFRGAWSAQGVQLFAFLHIVVIIINQHNNHYNWSAGLFSLGFTSLSSLPCQYAHHNGSDPRWQNIHNPSLITCLIVLCSLLRSEASLLEDVSDDHTRVHRVHPDPLRRHLVAVMVWSWSWSWSWSGSWSGSWSWSASWSFFYFSSLFDFTSFSPEEVPREQSSAWVGPWPPWTACRQGRQGRL